MQRRVAEINLKNLTLVNFLIGPLRYLNMKKILLVFFAPFLFMGAYAQQTVCEFTVDLQNLLDLVSASDTVGNVGYVFQSKKGYEFVYLSPDLRVEKTLFTDRVTYSKGDELEGAVVYNDNFTAYLYNKNQGYIATLSTERNSDVSKYSRPATLAKHENYLISFSMKGLYYVLVVPQHANKLKVLTFDRGEKIDEHTYDIEMPTFFAELAANNTLLNHGVKSNVGIEEIRYDVENNIKSSYAEKKLYHINGKIHLVFDDPNTTHLIVIDPAEHHAVYKKLNFSLERGNTNREKQGNSFMYYNRLFRATMSPEELNITILDLDAMEMINNYNIYPDKAIEINNGPVVQEGGGSLFSAEEKTIKKPEQYFRKVLNSNLAIAANKIEGNKYEVEVGSYDEVIYNNGGGMGGGGFGGPGLSIGMGMGGMGMGMGGMGMGGMGGMGMGYGGMGMGYGGMGYGYPGYYPSGARSNRINVVYFKTLMDTTDFSHLEGNVPVTVREKINDYETQNLKNTSPDFIKISPYNENTLLAYYTKQHKQFRIVKFQQP